MNLAAAPVAAPAGGPFARGAPGTDGRHDPQLQWDHAWSRGRIASPDRGKAFARISVHERLERRHPRWFPALGRRATWLEAPHGGLFDAYPRFFDTSETSPTWRLNRRYEAIFAENRDAFQGLESWTSPVTMDGGPSVPSTPALPTSSASKPNENWSTRLGPTWTSTVSAGKSTSS